MSHTFLWHDYETFGIDTRRDRPAQFAAIRTDDQLNEIGEPLMLYCQPSTDYLPDAGSCLITGITPQIAWQRGVTEREFAQRIEQEMAQPGTISVGYNSIRFDDEILLGGNDEAIALLFGKKCVPLHYAPQRVGDAEFRFGHFKCAAFKL